MKFLENNKIDFSESILNDGIQNNKFDRKIKEKNEHYDKREKRNQENKSVIARDIYEKLQSLIKHSVSVANFN